MKTPLAPFYRVFKDKTSGNKKFLSSEYLTHGKLAIVDQGQSTVAGFTDEIEASCKIKLPCVIFGDHTKKFQFQEKPFALGADGVKALEIARDVDPKYAYYAISLFRFPDGTGYSRHFKFLKEARISLPDDITEQRRIADILDKADAIRRKRQQSLKLIDDLVKSQFIEMFGDPVTNPMGWEIAHLSSLASLASGLTKGRKTIGQPLLAVPYMRVANVKDGYIDTSEVKLIDATDAEIRQYHLEKNDILMTEGGDPDKVGRGAIWTHDIVNCIHQNHIFRVRLNKGIHPVFFAEYLKQPKAKLYFLGCAKQTTGIASINMSQLKMLPVPMPPITLQNQFATFVEQADKSKFVMQNQLHEIETLSSALKQKFFA